MAAALWRRSSRSRAADSPQQRAVHRRRRDAGALLAAHAADASVPDDLQAWRLLNPNFVKGPRGQQFLRVVGRMRPGVSLENAQRDVAAAGDAIGRSFVEYGGSGWRLFAVGLQTDAMREVRPAVLALFAGSTVLLLIACVNVASLLIARAASRRSETALRLALGAGRARLFRQYLVEGVILALFGTVAALPVAWGALQALLTLRPETLSRIDQAHVDVQVLAFTCAVALTWGLLFSLAPFTEVFRTQLVGALRHGRERAVASGLRFSTRASLVVVQIALGAVLLVAAGLLVRTVVNLQNVDVGFKPDGIQTFRVALGPRFRTPDALNAFARRMQDELAALPGDSRVAAISHLPYDNLPNWSTPYLPEGVTDRSRTREADSRAVTPGFFAMVSARLLAGRDFTDGDDQSNPFVAIVDERFAARAWPGEPAIGKRFIGDPLTTGTAATPVTVIGVVAHLRHRVPSEEVREQIYFAQRQVFRSPMAYLVRTSTDPAELSPSIRAAIARLDAKLPVFDVRPLDSYVVSARAVRHFTMQLTAAFAAVALLLACVGVYGVVSYAVVRRQHEFGVRIALGARHGQVVRLVMNEGLRLAAVGLAIGLLAATRAAAVLGAQLFGVSAYDPVSYVVAIPVLAVATAVACWLPARRATAANPLDALRAE